MEKDIGKIPKNAETDIVVRIDDFGGKPGLTIREFVRGERYQGFTKNGTRIPAEKFKDFKMFINSIDEKDFAVSASSPSLTQSTISKDKKPVQKQKEDVEEDSEEDFDESVM